MVAAGLVLGPGLLNGGESRESVAGELASGASGFGKPLPAGTGEIREVSLTRLIMQVPKAPPPKPVGPYGGDCAVSRDGGTGGITVRVGQPEDRPHGQDMIGEGPCEACPQEGQLACTSEKLSDVQGTPQGRGVRSRPQA